MNIVVVYDESILGDANILYYWFAFSHWLDSRWLAHTFAMLHSILNPVVYYVRNTRFREGIRYFLQRCLPLLHFDEASLPLRCDQKSVLQISKSFCRSKSLCLFDTAAHTVLNDRQRYFLVDSSIFQVAQTPTLLRPMAASITRSISNNL